MKRWIGILLCPLPLLAGLIGWRLKGKSAGVAAQKAAITARQKAPASVNVALVALTDVAHTYTGIGSVESPFNVRISSKVNGRVDFLQKREGDPVAAGEVVARIDPTQVNAMINQAQSAVAEAQARLSQARITQDPNTVNVHSQIDTQRASLNSAEANYNQTVQNYTSQVQAAQSAITDSQGKLDVAKAGIVSRKSEHRQRQSKHGKHSDQVQSNSMICINRGLQPRRMWMTPELPSTSLKLRSMWQTAS